MHLGSLTSIGIAAASVIVIGGCGSGGSGQSDDSQPSRPFNFPVRIAAGPGEATGIARGDLDSDGIDDLAMSMLSDDAAEAGVLLLTLDRFGRVADTQLLVGMRRPIDAVIVDVDQNGTSDIVALDEVGEIAVFLHSLPGVWAAPVPYSVGDGPIQLIAGEFTGDGILDILTVNNLARDVTVLPGRGDGSFGQVRTSPTQVFNVIDADVGDVNQDGELDLAVAGSNELALLFGLGNGRFQLPALLPSGGANQGVRIDEVTGDPFIDIVLSSAHDGELRVLEGNGAGAFVDGYTFFVGNPLLGRLEVTDLDHNGTQDIALSSSAGIHALMGGGDGTFQPRPVAPALGSLDKFVVTDINGDLAPDVVAPIVSFNGLDFETSLAILVGLGTGEFEAPTVFPAGESPSGLVLGDFVVDGISDVAVFSQFPGEVRVLPGAADGSFGAPISTEMAIRPTKLAVADLDGNTLEDLLVLPIDFGAGQLALLSSAGNGLFDPPAVFPAGGVGPSSVQVADLNGDEVLDVVVANGVSNQIAVHLGEPGGTFTKPMRFGTGLGPRELILVDLDSDGLGLDVIVVNQEDQTVSVLLGNGDGTFGLDVAYPVEGFPNSLAVGDLDRDGHLDVVVASFDDGSVPGGLGFLRGLGDGSLGGFQRVMPAVTFASLLELCDFDGDGRLDLMWSGTDGLSLSLDSEHGFGEPSIYRGAVASDVAIHDVNRDGLPDLLLTNPSVGGLQVFLNQGSSAR